MSSSLAVVLTTLLGGRAFAERLRRRARPRSSRCTAGAAPARTGTPRSRGTTRWPSTSRVSVPRRPRRPAGARRSTPSGWPSASTRSQLRGARPVLVGHSFGGRVAVQLAATNPELVRGIVLTGVPLLRPETAARQAGVQLPRAAVPQQVALHLQRPHGEAAPQARLGRLPRGARARCVRCWSRRSTRTTPTRSTRSASNGLPVAMVWGEHDTAATTAMAERARARIGAHADLVVVPGSAHLLDDGAGRRAAHRHRRDWPQRHERNRERAGRAGDLAARPGVVPALVAGRAARALRAGPAGGHGRDLVPGPARQRPRARRGARALPGRPEAAAGRRWSALSSGCCGRPGWRCCGRARSWCGRRASRGSR